AAKAEAAERNGDTVQARAEQYLEQYCKRRTRPTTWINTEGIFRRDILPAWGERSVHDIKRRDVIDLVERIAEERPVMANRALTAISKFFSWLISRDVVDASPAVGVAAPTKEKPRERVLDDDEIIRLWNACDELPNPFGAIYRLLLLTGARRQEVAQLQWRELDEKTRTWTLPSERSKTHAARKIPLSRQAWAILAAQPRIVGMPYIFSRRIAFSHVKPTLDENMKPNSDWVTHDLRRSFASGMQRIGVDIAVTEKMLGHKSGSFRGVIGVYQRHEYLDEMRAALQKWADHIDRLLSGKPAKVIPMHRRRRR